MTSEEYIKMRPRPDLLYNYWLKEGGKVTNKEHFIMFLSMYIRGMGYGAKEGEVKIVNFLDKKFGYIKKNV